MFFENIEEYIKRPIQERQCHLDLESECIEIGTTSTTCRALLCHFVGVSNPKGNKILLCHRCHNHACSNPKHLYWGTPRENNLDARENGKLTVWQAMISKYGLEEAKKKQGRKGNKNAKGNANKLKPEDHKSKIAESVRESWRRRR